MDVHVARQPIFDLHRRLYGYELLYRKSDRNFYEGTDDDEATISLINDTFMVFGFNELVDRTSGFINFSQNLLQSDLIYVLPKEQVVIEILERVAPTDDVVAACRMLKSRGYILALDDFVLDENSDSYLPLIELADIIKIEFPAARGDGIQELMTRLTPRVTFLAEKVETEEEYQLARKMGFRLFQGYFFSRPIMSNAKEIGSLNANLLRVLEELNKPEVNYRDMSEVIQRDVGLSYKLLRMANSLYFGTRNPVNSIQQALVRLGTQEISRWVMLMLLRGIQRVENAELVKTSIIRGKMLSLIARELGNVNESDYFVAGIFSSLDVLLNTSMDNALSGLALSDEVIEALLGTENQLRRVLDSLLSFERATWDDWDPHGELRAISCKRFMALYVESLRWQQALA